MTWENLARTHVRGTKNLYSTSLHRTFVSQTLWFSSRSLSATNLWSLRMTLAWTLTWCTQSHGLTWDPSVRLISISQETVFSSTSSDSTMISLSSRIVHSTTVRLTSTWNSTGLVVRSIPVIFKSIFSLLVEETLTSNASTTQGLLGRRKLVVTPTSLITRRLQSIHLSSSILWKMISVWRDGRSSLILNHCFPTSESLRRRLPSKVLLRLSSRTWVDTLL